MEALQQLSVRATAVACDVRNMDSVQAAVAAVVEQFGGLDILVNNAGTFETAALQSITLSSGTRCLRPTPADLSLWPRRPIPAAKARGRIINIGSLGGMHPWPTHAHYCTSKAALHMLTQTMAKAFAPEISVNCVAPGMVVNGEVDPAYEHFANKTPMQRNGTPNDVAEAVLFFARGPHFITGQILGVDGGLGL